MILLRGDIIKSGSVRCVKKRKSSYSSVMKTVFVVFLVAIGGVALMMIGLGVKMLLHKEKEFKRPCANADPKTGRCAHCTCGRKEHSATAEKTP